MFILAGQSNMDGNANVSTIDFLGEDKEHGALLKKFKPAGWLNQQRDLKKQPVTPEEEAMLKRATSNLGYHYFGEGRFFILLGKAMAETMQELMGVKK